MGKSIRKKAQTGWMVIKNLDLTVKQPPMSAVIKYVKYIDKNFNLFNERRILSDEGFTNVNDILHHKIIKLDKDVLWKGMCKAAATGEKEPPLITVLWHLQELGMNFPKTGAETCREQFFKYMNEQIDLQNQNLIKDWDSVMKTWTDKASKENKMKEINLRMEQLSQIRK